MVLYIKYLNEPIIKLSHLINTFEGVTRNKINIQKISMNKYVFYIKVVYLSITKSGKHIIHSDTKINQACLAKEVKDLHNEKCKTLKKLKKTREDGRPPMPSN